MPDLAHLAPGAIFAGQFRVVRPLKEGGMGALYVVDQLRTGHQRALKVMHPQFARDAKSRERFEQEAQIGAQIESEHVVQVIGAGVDDATGTPWLAMELLKGDDLAAETARRGALPPAEVREIFAQLCHALGAAHRAGIVHRDLKPENVFLAESRRSDGAATVKVLDFGISKWLQENRTAATATAIIGSPLWMAPEQLDEGGKIRAATDVWALGLIAFYLLTGKNYWRAANAQPFSLPTLVREIIMPSLEPPTARVAALAGPPGTLPAGFDAWFARCVAPDSAARFADATAAYAALAPVLGDGPIPHTRVAPAAKPALPRTEVWTPTTTSPLTAGRATPLPVGAAPQGARRSPLPWVVGGVLLLAGGVFAATRFMARGAATDARPAAAAAAVTCALPQHASDGHCCGRGEEWVATREACVCLTPGECGAAAGAASARADDATAQPGTTAGPAAVLNTGPAAAVVNPVAPLAVPCAGVWSGTMNDNFHGTGSASLVLEPQLGGARCGRLTERWGRRTCVFDLSACALNGLVVQASGSAESAGCSPAAITLTCTDPTLSIREVPTGSPQDATFGRLARAAN